MELPIQVHALVTSPTSNARVHDAMPKSWVQTSEPFGREPSADGSQNARSKLILPRTQRRIYTSQNTNPLMVRSFTDFDRLGSSGSRTVCRRFGASSTLSNRTVRRRFANRSVRSSVRSLT
ncbi:unnamed protein product [Ilex paraguariensis]|uniref:Uncharacterized protein n=1 Tax=Ilex paraguariensis TaxID=185542 RepID=A0ABC8QQI0_9AQUA